MSFRTIAFIALAGCDQVAGLNEYELAGPDGESCDIIETANLLSNPSFEAWNGNAPSDWNVFAGTTARSEMACHGNYSLRLTVSDNDDVDQQVGPTEPSKGTATARIWLLAAGEEGGMATLYFEASHGGDGAADVTVDSRTFVSSALRTDSWTPIDGELNLNLGILGANKFSMSLGGKDGSIDMLVDGAQLIVTPPED